MTAAVHLGAPTSVRDAGFAARNARYWTRVALDRAMASQRHHHPGVHSHLTSALVQLQAAIPLTDPSMDQIDPREAA
jgi:hypothetical protein